jgi:hypothetical protein
MGSNIPASSPEPTGQRFSCKKEAEPPQAFEAICVMRDQNNNGYGRWGPCLTRWGVGPMGALGGFMTASPLATQEKPLPSR